MGTRGSSVLLALSALLAPAVVYAGTFVEVPLAARLNEATLVIEGRVLEQSSSWNAARTVIVTSSRIEIYKIFRGHLSDSTVLLVTEGGTVGNSMHLVEPELSLKEGETGLFLAKENTQIPLSGLKERTYLPVAAAQGMIRYEPKTQTAFDVFRKYGSLNQLYSNVQSILGQPYRSLGSLPKAPLAPLAPPNITSFSPNPVTAGTFTTLTINGTDFGATFSGSANVEFRNADNGGAGFLSIFASHVVSWSDTQIQVRVPTGAGTGTFRVTNSGGEQGLSASSLTITYNQTNATSAMTHFEPNLINSGGTGGYRVRYSTNTANSGVNFDGHALAKTRYETALQNWRCNTDFNVLPDSLTTTAAAPAALDGTNLVAFDNSAGVLPAGVLGRATSFFSSCDGINWSVSEIDIVFKRDGTDSVTWYFGADPGSQPGGTSDFESVALHEIGHNHMLGHVISPGAVMHFSITVGTNNRVLNPAQDIAGGDYVMSHSTTFNQCGRTGMILFDCASAPVANFTASPLSSCNVPAVVQYTDLSQFQPTSWDWSFPGGTPNSSTIQHPSVTYNTPGQYDAALTATNAFGNDVETKTGFITVGGKTLPVLTDFQIAFFPPTEFMVVNPDAGFTWGGIIGPIGSDGDPTTTAFLRHFLYDNPGTDDDLITFAYNLHGIADAELKFDVAYRRFDAAFFDRLRVLASTNCGASFPGTIYDKSGATLATLPDSATEFFPGAAADWREETVDLSGFANTSLILNFRTTNGFGNNLFVDNIRVRSASDHDGDGTVNAADCAPLNPTVWSAPTAATSLTVAGTQVSWNPPAPLPGTSTQYDLLRSGDPSTFAAATCIASNQSGTSTTDAATPAAGSVFFYVTRVENFCGSHMGTDSGGTPRTGISCP